MTSGMQLPENLQGAIDPIGATVFGANVSSITRGVTGPRQPRRSSARSASHSTVISCHPTTAACEPGVPRRREAVRHPYGRAGMTPRSRRSNDCLEPIFQNLTS